MIKLRLNAISSNEIECKAHEGENLKLLIKRLLHENGLDGDDPAVLEHFSILYNGQEMPREFWEFCKIEEGANVLIAPTIKGGNFGQIFKVVATIVVTAYVGSLTAGMGSPFVAGLITGSAAVLTSLVLNALIPPPTPGAGEGLSDYAESQMFTISSQSNSVKKYANVPKLYGTHRMFPNVAATPYTELETDPSTGKLVQYLYCIYDFGLGPMNVSKFMLGDTPITTEAFRDFNFNLVDPNKPAVSEGPWDNLLSNQFKLYRGSNNSENFSIGLNKNSNDPGVFYEDYVVVRNAGENVQDVEQEISINIAAPQGLYCLGTNAARAERTIELEIEFAKVGTENWRKFNDMDYVQSARSVGGIDTVFADVYLTPLAQQFGPLLRRQETATSYDWFTGQYYTGIVDLLYYPAGTQTILVLTTEIDVGDFFKGYIGGDFQATVTAKTEVGPSLPNWSYVTLSKPFPVEIIYYILAVPENLINLFYIGAGAFWQRSKNSFGKLKFTGNDTTPVYASVKFVPKEIGSYKVRISRIQTYSTYTYQRVDNLVIYNITTRFSVDAIKTDKRHTFLEIKMRATDQLNGAIQNLSAVCTSALDVYDPDTQTWSKQLTGNPAWVFADLLTGEVNKRAISKSRLDLDSLVEWAEFCDEIPPSAPSYNFTAPRFRTNFILDYNTTLQSVLNSVANGAQASLNIIDGKYGVLVDKLRTVPVQIFTPRNSSNFTSTRTYSSAPHALKIKYIEPSADWQQIERIVYDDGYDALTATEFQELDTFACTDPEQAWRFGRYMIAQNRLRQEQITLDVDFEYLVCTRGDYVQVTQDVMLAGGLPARVKEVSGNTIIIDDGIATQVGVDYGYVYRNADVGIKTSTLIPLSSTQFTVDGDIPEEGDLIVIGEVGSIVMDCIVKAIRPNDDLTAQILLVEKADAIYSAESSMTLPQYLPDLSENVVDGNTPPGEVQALEVTANTWRFTGAGYEYYVDLDWDVPITGGIYEAFEVYVDSGTGYNLYSVTKESEERVIIDQDFLGLEHNFKVIAVSATGAKLELNSVTAVSATPVSKTTRPSDVEALYLNITNEVLQLNWPAVSDVDVKEYLIRYSPIADASWSSSIPLLRTGNVNTTASTQARTGTYLIKALDWNGNESEEVATAITSIPELFNLNVISETTDFPDLLGTADQVQVLNGSLIIQNKVSGGVTTNEYYEEGYYYYQEFLDLGDIYSVRLQSLIQAEGYTIDDLMSEWPTLSSVTLLANSKFSEWDVESQVRATNSFNVMAEWDVLADIDPLSEGEQDNFTPWRSFTMGDFTGRIFQFRLRLRSFKPSVSPRVFDGEIRADMPDRTDIYNNVLSTISGTKVVTYSTPFKGPGTSPNIQITQDNAESGDYFVISNKTLAGFEIIFYDNTNTQVVRQFDVAARGFGRRSANTI